MEHFTACSVLGALLALLIFTIDLKTCSARVAPHSKINTEFIRTHCGATTYPKVCLRSLSSYASTIQKSPKQMANTALSVSLTGARSTSATMVRLSTTTKGMTPTVVAAMKDCIETMSDTIDELRQSSVQMGHLRGPDFDEKINDIQTWVSAALTDEDTCMDGFSGNAMNGNVKNMVRGRILNVAKLTSNALALINALASAQHKSP